MAKKYTVVLGQVGSPKSTNIKDVRKYLREFLSDPRVVDLPRGLWFIILNLFILPFRPKQSAKAYKRIEFCGFFPLMEITKSFARALQNELGDNYSVEASFLLASPRLKHVIAQKDNLVVLPQFPQFSDTTTSSCTDQIKDVYPTFAGESEIKVLKSFHRLKAFIDCSVLKIEKHLIKYPCDILVLSFHGIPQRYVTQKHDPYYLHCCETFTLLKEKLSFHQDKIFMCFQSRLGSEKWLSPYTDEFICHYIENHPGNTVGVYCPSFVVDCLETTDEIGNELLAEVEKLGGELVFIPCLNNDSNWVHGYGEMVKYYCEEENEKFNNLFYEVAAEKVRKNMPELKDDVTPMSSETKRTIKIIFFTLFLDLVGFSIIFPMFPALAKYYLEIDPNNYFLRLIFDSINALTAVTGGNMSAIVLFGGALGALYSLLQFFAAPLWGGLSDRFGRKPILLISVFGLFVSYILWIFSGSFTLLVLARFVGGIMGGNISVASAVITDVTDTSNRSKGMAFIGIAFALGFIFGPALGGLLTIVNPLNIFPSLGDVGINPFSFAALLAASLSFINLIILYRSFSETLDSKKSLDHVRSANLLKLFTPLPGKEVNLINYVYFLFISAFSGMEFTLTFLAVERLSYSSMDNAYMFIFIGIIIALVQGGFVRRKAHQIGEKKVAIMGLVSIIPGLLAIAIAKNSLVIYVGLLFLAMGSAMAIPTLTSLVSFFTPDHLQGKSMGIFRSLGALGRVIGPIVASLIYWRMGSMYPYLLGSLFLLIPILILIKVHEKPQDNEAI